MSRHDDQHSAAYEAVVTYHQRSKHALHRYAAGPEAIDWEAQPNPFRHFACSHRVKLALTADTLTTPYRALYQTEAVISQPLDLKYIGVLFELSLGLSAWKQYGTARWSLRCNPSSGNLHPTEAYAVLHNVEGVADGVYHYHSHDHCLEQRCVPADENAATYRALLPAHSLLIGLSSIHWREAWKYGERAFRYCQHDCGHAVASIRYAAAALGWSVRLLDDWSEEQIDTVLGLNRDCDFSAAEEENAELMLLITAQPHARASDIPTDALAQLLADGNWQGRANTLDNRHHYDWQVIDDIANTTAKPAAPLASHAMSSWPQPLQSPSEAMAATIIRQRRSAQAFDAKTTMSSASFYRLLDMTLPRHDLPPWDLWPYPHRTHLILFVHRVQGLQPGLYAFLRRPDVLDSVSAILRSEFTWQRPSDCPAHLSLYHLVSANCQRAAATLSCHQHIASDSCFSLAMLAEFDDALRQGPWHYRRLFWECGIIGQILYLEAEAAGLRGTGIGCYFDDAVHETLGLSDNRFQSLYHFTIGMPLDDSRLATLPPYQHLKAGSH